MKFSIRIANVYNTILEETKKELVIVKDRKTYIGKLFFKKDESEMVKKVFERIDFEGSAQDAMVVAYNLLKKYDMLAKDDKTLKTMLHWQYTNGLTDDIISVGYRYNTDTELLVSI